MLLILAYLYSHKGGVLLVDEPDAHLEILRQKQVYVLLREIASENRSQVVLVTHSEVILDEALDTNLTLLIDGRADDLAKRQTIRNSLKHFGAAHYLKARERGYVLYVDGGTDVDILRELAILVGHSVADQWDERINSFYVANNFPETNQNAELARVEGGFGITPKSHFNGLRELIPELRGLAILDSDGRVRQDELEPPLKMTYWKRYEIENYFVSPDLLRKFARMQFPQDDLLSHQQEEAIDDVLDSLVLEQVFENAREDFDAWKRADVEVARVLWVAQTRQRKLSLFAEEFFRRLSTRLGGQMLLTKGELHHLVRHVSPASIAPEVGEKLDLLCEIFPQTIQRFDSKSAK
jgi:hypothetical protein